jgi:predicted TIM-barrel fold metal-dependent hydrolase
MRESAPVPRKEQLMIIDADVHISPLTQGNRIPADEALRRMDRAGVDKALTWLQPSYIPNVEDQNAYIYRSMKQHPDRLLGFGWADPLDRGDCQDGQTARLSRGRRRV